MGFLRSIKASVRKAESAAIMQRLLNIFRHEGLTSLDPMKTADHLLRELCAAAPHLVDQRDGPLPNKFALAAIAFASAVAQRRMDGESLVFGLCLGRLLERFAVNADCVTLTRLDLDLLDRAAVVYRYEIKQFSGTDLGMEIKDLLSNPARAWEDWYLAFRDEVDRSNELLAVHTGGVSVVDLMDEAPLRQAYEAGLSPRRMGRELARGLRITEVPPGE